MAFAQVTHFGILTHQQNIGVSRARSSDPLNWSYNRECIVQSLCSILSGEKWKIPKRIKVTLSYFLCETHDVRILYAVFPFTWGSFFSLHLTIYGDRSDMSKSRPFTVYPPWWNPRWSRSDSGDRAIPDNATLSFMSLLLPSAPWGSRGHLWLAEITASFEGPKLYVQFKMAARNSHAITQSGHKTCCFWNKDSKRC